MTAIIPPTTIEITEDVILRDGLTLRLRPPGRDDADALVALLPGSLAGESPSAFPRRRQRRRATTVAPDARSGLDRARRAARLARGADGAERIVALASYVRLRDPDAAEVAFAVDDALSGTRHRHPAARAPGRPRDRAGIERFVAEVLADNRPMLGVFADAGFEADARARRGVVEVSFPIAPTGAFLERVDRARPRRRRRVAAAVLRTSSRWRSSAPRRGAARSAASSFATSSRRTSRARRIRSTGAAFRSPASAATRRSRRSRTTVDLAVVCVPGEHVLAAAEAACAAASARSASSRPDSPRSGEEGAERQRASCSQLVRAHGARLVGPELPRHRGRRPPPERDLRAPRAAAGHDRLLVAERCARSRPARGGGGAGPRPLGVRLDRQQGRCLVQRPARVVGGRPRRPMSCCSTSSRSATRASSAGSPAASRARKPILAMKSGHDGRGRARRQLAHGRARRLGGRRRRAVPPGRRDAREDARGADRRRGAALAPAAAARPPRRRADECRRARHPLRRRVRRRRARAAAALATRRRPRSRGAPAAAEASVANPVDLLGSATAATTSAALPLAARRPARRRGDRALRAAGSRRRGRGRRRDRDASAAAPRSPSRLVLSADGRPVLRPPVGRGVSVPGVGSTRTWRAAERADWLRRPAGTVPKLNGIDRGGRAPSIERALARRTTSGSIRRDARAARARTGVPSLPRALADAADEAGRGAGARLSGGRQERPRRARTRPSTAVSRSTSRRGSCSRGGEDRRRRDRAADARAAASSCSQASSRIPSSARSSPLGRAVCSPS